MKNAYRDDLAAAQLRVQDLEREHAALGASMSVYRDDLDAALQRAADLDRDNARLRARNAELERLYRPPTEDEANRARLADAMQRELEERAARERADRDEAELRRLARAHAPDRADGPRALAMTFALVGCVVAGAMGSLGGVAAVIVVAMALLRFVDLVAA